jgi:peptidoglycan/xylan/chitin deacetylase (PgdA/CDA1 family)
VDAGEAPVERALVPVLVYHAVTETPGRHIAPFTVTPATFARHLDALLAAGYRCTTLTGLVLERAGGGLRSDAPTAVLTFDDGYADFADTVVPALLDRGLRCTLYVTTGWLEGGPAREPGPSDRMLAWSQLPELVEAGCEMGAHSHSHPQLDTLGPAALREELVRPKALLEDALDRPVPSIAYPHGYNGPRVRRAARAAGHESGAAVRNRASHADEDPFRISRFMVTATTTPEDLSAWLQQPTPSRPPTDRESPLTTGWRMYRRGRALVRRRPGSDYR